MPTGTKLGSFEPDYEMHLCIQPQLSSWLYIGAMKILNE